MKKRIFELDIIKFFLMFAMVYRHVPLYLFHEQLVEFSLDQITLYSIFIPVTMGFISILGLSLGVSATAVSNSSYKYLISFIKLLLLSVTFGLITYIRDHGSFNFLEYIKYFFLCKRHIGAKPGFYILYPISLLFLSSFVIQYISIRYKKIVLILSISVLLLFNRYYSIYYLTSGLIFFLISYIGNIEKVISFLQKKSILIASLLLYISVYYIFADLNFVIEFIMLLLFCIIILNLKYMFSFISDFIKLATSTILIFYITHVVLLNFLKGQLILDNWFLVFVFGLALFFLTLAISISYSRIRFNVFNKGR